MTPDQLQTILDGIARTALPKWYVYFLFLFGAALAAGLGAWGGAYLKERGKRYATKEDFDSLLQELRRTTSVTEEIKAQTAGGLWLQQTRWGKRWDVYVDLMRALSAASMDCVDHLEELRAEARKTAGVLASDSPAVEKAKNAMSASLRALQQAGDVASIILPLNVFAALNAANEGLDSARTPADIERRFLGLQAVLDQAHTEIAVIARRDLHMPLAAEPPRKEGEIA
jgi:hypothetical protein